MANIPDCMPLMTRTSTVDLLNSQREPSDAALHQLMQAVAASAREKHLAAMHALHARLAAETLQAQRINQQILGRFGHQQTAP